MHIYTIGHSTRRFKDFVKILKKHKINLVIDVRHFPHSKHNPQFNREELETKLKKSGIGYKWLEKLGGFRPGGYKKYVKTKNFKDGFEELLSIDPNANMAIMCAEILWFKCHRRFIADELKRKKIDVIHIYDENKTDRHKITYRKKIKCD